MLVLVRAVVVGVPLCVASRCGVVHCLVLRLGSPNVCLALGGLVAGVLVFLLLLAHWKKPHSRGVHVSFVLVSVGF